MATALLRKKPKKSGRSASYVTGSLLKIARQPNAEIRVAIEHGLSPLAVIDLIDRLKLNKQLFSETVGLSVRTLDRKLQKKQPLSREEGATLVRVAKIHTLASRLFTSDEAISDWLTQPDSALDGQTPLAMLSNEFTAAEVEDLLQGMIHGFVA